MQELNYQRSLLYEVEEMKKRLPNKLADNVTETTLLQEGSKYPDLTAYDYFYGDTFKEKFILQ